MALVHSDEAMAELAENAYYPAGITTAIAFFGSDYTFGKHFQITESCFFESNGIAGLHEVYGGFLGHKSIAFLTSINFTDNWCSLSWR